MCTSAKVPGRKAVLAVEREVHELVLARAPGGDRADPSCSAPRPGPPRPVRCGPRCFARPLRSTTTRSRSKRSADHVRRHEVVDPRRRLGARAGREDEGVGAVVLGCGHDLERVLEVVVGLAREADDEVGRHGEVVDGRTGRCQSIEVALGRCSRGAWRPARGRSRPAAAGAGARTPPVSRPWPSMVSGRRSFGCGLVKRTRRMPSPTARSRSPRSNSAATTTPAGAVVR